MLVEENIDASIYLVIDGHLRQESLMNTEFSISAFRVITSISIEDFDMSLWPRSFDISMMISRNNNAYIERKCLWFLG